MSSVNVFADVQGFYIRGTFFPRELAIYSEDYWFYATFDLPVLRFSNKEMKTINHCTSSIHGIPWRSTENDAFSFPVKMFRDILKHFCRKWSFCGSIGVRNQHLNKILVSMGFKVYNMETHDVSTTKYYNCDFHGQKNKCAMNKVINLYKSMYP